MSSPTARRLRIVLLALAGCTLLAAVAPPVSAAEPVPGGSGTDTSLPATDSQATVSGRGRFADLKITVNQTKDLVNQAISITWTGGTPTTTDKRFDNDFLQIMQCWGDDDGSVPENPGPPPEQCVFGAANGVPDGRIDTLFGGGPGAQVTREVGRPSFPGFDPADGVVDPGVGGAVYKPFRAVDGTEIDFQNEIEFNSNNPGSYWLNPYFNFITTNEIPGSRTRLNGEGAALFEATTGLESSGLGCGQQVEPVAGGARRTPRCWLVIVPRGSAADENAEGADPRWPSVKSSPLGRRPWQNRIAVPLEFNPIESPCSLADDSRRLAGTELALPAVVSWQPTLCTKPGLPPYSFGVVSDAAARQQLLGGVIGGPGMIVVPRPFDRSMLDPDNPVTYAPISLSGLVIGFNVERVPQSTPTPPPEVTALGGVRVAELNLTPRLVAKLLTQSYRSQVAINGTAPPYEWVKGNPAHLGVDPDFREFNPEFELLTNNGKNFGGLVMSGLNSDAARQVWEWVLADPEARAWLDGAPDPSGMKVNPVYATTAAANSAGVAFADPLPNTFPKGDPYCYQGPGQQGASAIVIPPPLCGNDWLPYAGSLREAARSTRAADDGAKTVEKFNDALRPEQVYRRDGPQNLGSRTMLSLTDSASAAQYGIQSARLSRAGDNRPDRVFVAPDVAGLTAGVASMAPRGEPAVLEPAPAADAPSAYPLTALTYAAITPLSLDAKSREEYAGFIDYAAGPGQVAGLELGRLPRGFAPLPEALRAQATEATKTIRELQPAVASTDQLSGPATPTSVEGSGTTTAAASSSSGSGRSNAATTPAASSSILTVADSAPPTPLSRALTPILALARSRFVLPWLVGIALLSALGALEITKRPRSAPRGTVGTNGRAPNGQQAGAPGREGAIGRWPVKR